MIIIKKNRMITQGELRNQIEYDSETGLWRWRDHTRGRRGGWFAGTPQPHNYLTIWINGVKFYAHRLAWLWVYGEWPEHIDHINRDKTDNRLENLRNVSKSVNQMNAGLYVTNSSGCKGVIYYRGRWRGSITKDKKSYQAWFKTREEAIAWRQAKQEELFGEFARVVPLDRKQG